jgi:hypothetical protein
LGLYIRTLFDWAATTWDYSLVDDWNTDKYFLVHIQEYFLKVYKLDNKDKDVLFQGKHKRTPEPLKDYQDRDIQAFVFFKISEREYNKLIVL